MVSNHASRLDYIYAGLAFLPMRLNFVAGYYEFYDLRPLALDYVLPARPRAWYDLERVRLGTLPRFQYLGHEATSEKVGEGEPFAFALPSAKVPTYGMCADVTRFYIFHKGEFLEFYPEGETTIKWLLATEEVHRANGGPWKDFTDDRAAGASPKSREISRGRDSEAPPRTERAKARGDEAP